MQRTLPVIAVNGVVDAQVSPFDRGFSYGDGLFETCKLQDAKISLWDLHKDRLIKGCQKLSIPVAIESIEAQLEKIISEISSSELENAVVKITVTRGSGGRGYRLPAPVSPTIVIGILPAPSYPAQFYSEGVSVRICKQRLSSNPALAGLKHLNRLEQILARAEWSDESIAEGLMFDSHDNLIEAVFSNIFLIKDSELLTPDLSEAGVAGVMRRFILETLAPKIDLKVHVKVLRQKDILNADAIFLCNSLYGIWAVTKLFDDDVYEFPNHPVVAELQRLICKAHAE